MLKGEVFCIAGIDTGIGKTIATGLIARGLAEAGHRVITQKAVQTGCRQRSEDIERHRQLMGRGRLAEDREGLTCPYLFAKPCSPHLAARLENRVIAPARITAATEHLRNRFEVVLLEGAGGLFVPLTEDLLFIDYLARVGWPVVLVTSARLGSINHSLATLEALRLRGMPLAGVVYNDPGDTDREIAADSRRVIARFLAEYGFVCPLVEMKNAAVHSHPGGCAPFLRLCGR
jgi:dethiobiotin synthetase